MKTKLFISGLALIATIAVVNAQSNGCCKNQQKRACKSSTYVDNNKNGVCDNAEKSTANVSGKKGNGTGKCNGMGQGQSKGNCSNFIDANKDGVCDNKKTAAKK